MVHLVSAMTLFSFIFFVVWRWLGWLFRLGRLPRKFLHVHSSCPGRGSRWVYQWVPRAVQEPAVHGTAHTMNTRSRDGSSVNLPAAQCPHSHPRGREHTPLTTPKPPPPRTSRSSRAASSGEAAPASPGAPRWASRRCRTPASRGSLPRRRGPRYVARCFVTLGGGGRAQTVPGTF